MPGMDDKRLQETLDQVRANRDEADKFSADPEGYLRSKGIDTQDLKFAQIRSNELSEADLEVAAGGATDYELAPTVCSSVGAGTGVIVCSSVGDEQQT